MLGVWAMVPSVAAFEVTNCTLILQSFDADGQPLDTAIGEPGRGDRGTREEPFLVDPEGTVLFQGHTGDQVITDFEWSVDLFLIPTPLRGGHPNPEGQTTLEGEIDVAASLPFRMTGLYFVSGQLVGDGGSCRGSGWFQLIGEPADSITTVPFWIAVLVLLAGVLTLWAARPRLEMYR